jgi:hypothetical protein
VVAVLTVPFLVELSLLKLLLAVAVAVVVIKLLGKLAVTAAQVVV